MKSDLWRRRFSTSTWLANYPHKTRAPYLAYNGRLASTLRPLLRAEMTDRFGVRFDSIVNGQAEIAGVPTELLEVFSKRAAQVDAALDVKEAEFREREQREPTKFEHAAMQREAAADTRRNKTGNIVTDLRTRWIDEANEVGVTAKSLVRRIEQAAKEHEPAQRLTTSDVERLLAEKTSTWHRLDVLRTLTDELRPRPGTDGQRWLVFLERSADAVIDAGIDLDPATTDQRRRESDGRSIWVEPIASHYTSNTVLAQEEEIALWALDRQAPAPSPAATVRSGGLDDMQADAAAAVAGQDTLVIVVGPAGSGKTTMLARAIDDLEQHGRDVFAVAPTAKAARVLARETGVTSDTVAKLIHEWTHPDRPPEPTWRLAPGTTLLVDEAGMLSTGDLHTLTRLATDNRWRVALLGDPQQLHAVGRGGMFDELCTNGRVHQLTRIHRFTEQWEPAASLALRRGDPRAIDTYIAQDRVNPGTIHEHLVAIAERWMEVTAAGQSIAVTAATNAHVEVINKSIQCHRLIVGDIKGEAMTIGINEQPIHIGDHIATRHNERHLRTSSGDMVRNRETWTVTGITADGDITARRHLTNDTVTLPAEYVADHVQLGYATTEPGNQGDTHDIAVTLVTPATTKRGLYVSMTRGRETNTALVVTDEPTIDAAADVLCGVLASDRTDTPAIAQRRGLAQQIPSNVRGPRLQPRCKIPDWWHTVRSDTLRDLASVERKLSAMHAGQQARRPKLDVARAAAERAVAALGPHRANYDIASQRLEHAESRYAVAEADVTKIGFRGRRAARARLDEATTELAEARLAFKPITDIWTPLRRTADRAIRTYNEMGESHRMQATLGDLRQLPERLTYLRNRVSALDTWGQWATGCEITIGAATRMASVFVATDDDHLHALADAVVAITPVLIVDGSTPEVDFDNDLRFEEIELGIDL